MAVADTKLNDLTWEPGRVFRQKRTKIFDQGHAKIDCVSVDISRDA